MNLINICFIIFIIILFILYINYSKSYTDFILNENSLVKLENKIYYLKQEYDYKYKLIKSYRKLLNIDDFNYLKHMSYITQRYNTSLRLINIEIEQIKNLNKEYGKKFKELDNINNLYIIKKDYNKRLYKIQDIGYIMIINLEKDNSKLLKNLYTHNINELKNKDNQLFELQQNYELDMGNINQDYIDKLNILKNKLEGKLKKGKKKKYNCKLHISWGDLESPMIKCCPIKIRKK